MPDWARETDDGLLLAAREDATAFSAFYRRYERVLLLYFRRRGLDAELSADLTAEVFAAVLAALPRYRPGDAPTGAWVFGIARHKLASSRRRGRVEARARQSLRMMPLALEDEDLRRIDAIGSDAALKLLDELPAQQRAVVEAHVVEERPYADIARELRCSEAVVRKRVSRGLAQLRHRLESEEA
jgi:RNA polymerase sigma-70 factor (ECF subfamily)